MIKIESKRKLIFKLVIWKWLHKKFDQQYLSDYIYFTHASSNTQKIAQRLNGNS